MIIEVTTVLTIEGKINFPVLCEGAIAVRPLWSDANIIEISQRTPLINYVRIPHPGNLGWWTTWASRPFGRFTWRDQ